MKSNVGVIDRGLRIALGGSLIVWAAAFDGPALAYLGVIPLLTGVVGMCGLYALLGINTCRLRS